MHSFHKFAALFGAFTKPPRRVTSEWGNVWLLIDTTRGSYDFPSMAAMRYAIAIEDASGYLSLPF